MLSPETLEQYRGMTPGQRLSLTLEMMQDAERYLLKGSPEQVWRKFEWINRQNDERNRAMLQAIANSERPEHEQS